ncbi:DUF2935 domain-containing protein [Heyndrickxia oleronia]|uniref:DUF2935 domain-containing protein n=1 Tax=Heyndrickxia oleronia TaxID=38875 RepID=UPI0020418695|nr:DUF2935 domain-containing protein [Heyndrickxia oleronia]MCM3456663.1 DUF2935 domain-containing protein [Heyndrickxia oleronia]
MQFYYRNQMPLRVLDECEFWKQQEEEHTVVIRELVKDLETEFFDALFEWETAFREANGRVVRFIETTIRTTGTFTYELYRELTKLVSFCLEQSVQFIAFCNQLIQESEPIVNNPTAKVVMKHIIDESEYFVGIAQAVLYSKSI